MRSRAVLWPSICDPFQNKLWFKLFQERWGEEVDKVYVCLNSSLQADVVDFTKNFLQTNPKFDVTVMPHMIQHGNAIKEVLAKCQEEYVMLIEDDGLIFKPNMVESCFYKIERDVTDIIASHRQSATPNIAEAARAKFNGHHSEMFFWPNFFFIRTAHLRKTDQIFGTKSFTPGEYIPELGWRVEGDVGADTFVWASIQLRAMGLRVEYVEQYHAMAEDIYFAQNKMRAWAGAPWVHLGSLSSVMSNFLFDSKGFSLAQRGAGTPIDFNRFPHPPDWNDEGVKLDLESRIANTKLAYDLFKNECGEIAEFVQEYGQAIDRAITGLELRPELIDQKISIYKQLYGL